MTDDDAVVTVRDVHYAIGTHVIFKGLNVQMRRGAIIRAAFARLRVSSRIKSF